jgi:hypothetical protein
MIPSLNPGIPDGSSRGYSSGKGFLYPFFGLVHLSGGTVHLNGPCLAPQQFIHGPALGFPDNIPARRLNPKIPPPEKTRLPQEALNAIDISGVVTDEVASNEVTQPLSLLS